jgi:hypothetical protein
LPFFTTSTVRCGRGLMRRELWLPLDVTESAIECWEMPKDAHSRRAEARTCEAARRDAIGADGMGLVAVKNVRPGDWVMIGGARRRVTACYDRPPGQSESSCYMRPGQVWLRLGKREVVALHPDELLKNGS